MPKRPASKPAASSPSGAGLPTASHAGAPARSRQAPELVNHQRNGGFAATLHTVTVRIDGSTRADKRYGGAGRRFDDFRLSAPLMARLRVALHRLPPRIPAVGDGMRAGATYLLRYRGRTYVAKQGGRGPGSAARGRGHPERHRRRRRPCRARARRHAGALLSARAANLLGAHALVVCDRMREAAGMELSSAAVLTALETFADGASIDALRRVLGLSHSGGVRIVQRLEAEGLVAREPDPADGRAVRLHLTGAGEREARRLLAARQAALTPLLAGLGERERAALERLLERLLASVTAGGDDANRICRLCDPGVCGHPDRCPVTQAAVH